MLKIGKTQYSYTNFYSLTFYLTKVKWEDWETKRNEKEERKKASSLEKMKRERKTRKDI